MATFASAPVDVVGIVAEKARHVGRTIRGREIVGTVAEVKGVLERLSVHGVAVDTVVVAADERFLSPEALDELDQLELNGSGLSIFISSLASRHCRPLPHKS